MCSSCVCACSIHFLTSGTYHCSSFAVTKFRSLGTYFLTYDNFYFPLAVSHDGFYSPSHTEVDCEALLPPPFLRLGYLQKSKRSRCLNDPNLCFPIPPSSIAFKPYVDTRIRTETFLSIIIDVDRTAELMPRFFFRN
ncbi:hypothetical protein MPTK2_7g03310 [Marchantia polymorpha subsp. ruderalis]